MLSRESYTGKADKKSERGAGTQRGRVAFGRPHTTLMVRKKKPGLRSLQPPFPGLTPAVCPCRYLWVRLGEHHLWQWEGPEQLFRVTDFFPHPGFNSDLSANDHNHDIMLIRLPRRVSLGPVVQPLNISRTCVSPGTKCLISGWGAVSSPKGMALSMTHSL